MGDAHDEKEGTIILCEIIQPFLKLLNIQTDIIVRTAEKNNQD